MLSPNIITHIAATPIPAVGWRRAGLLGEPRACLGECELGELYALCAVQTTTPEGLAFTRYAGTMVGILERYSATVDQALSGVDDTLLAMTEDAYQAWRELRGWEVEAA